MIKMEDKAKVEKAEKVNFHIDIEDQLSLLDEAIDNLEKLYNRICGGDTEEMKSVDRSNISLSEFLTSTSGKLADKTERINRYINNISVSLF